MINIIKSGKNKEIKEVTCDRCNCEFSFSREDCYWDRGTSVQKKSMNLGYTSTFMEIQPPTTLLFNTLYEWKISRFASTQPPLQISISQRGYRIVKVE